MSDRFKIVAEPRTIIGKQVKQLRRQGLIPAVIYGQKESVPIQLDNLMLRRTLRDAGSTNLIDIDLGDGARTVLARHIDLHPTRGELVHVDFYEVNLKQSLTSEAALVTIGESPTVADGQGTIMLLVHSVQIEALPDDLISEVEVDISQIETPDDLIYVRDLQTPRGVTLLTDPETVVAKFDYLRVEEEEEEEEEEVVDSDEVEVIAKGKADEEGAAKTEAQATEESEE